MFFIQKLLVIPPKFRPPLIFTDKMIESSISELYKVCFHYLVKIILLLRSNPSRQHSKHYIAWQLREEERQKHRKVEVKRKWLVSAQPPYHKEMRQSPGWKPMGDRSTYVEDNPGSQYRQRLGEQVEPQVHSRYIHIYI